MLHEIDAYNQYEKNSKEYIKSFDISRFESNKRRRTGFSVLSVYLLQGI